VGNSPFFAAYRSSPGPRSAAGARRSPRPGGRRRRDAPPPQPRRGPPQRAGKAARPHLHGCPRTAGRTLADTDTRPPAGEGPRPALTERGSFAGPAPKLATCRPHSMMAPPPTSLAAPAAPADINPAPPARRLAPAAHTQGAGLSPASTAPSPSHWPLWQPPGSLLAARPRGGS